MSTQEITHWLDLEFPSLREATCQETPVTGTRVRQIRSNEVYLWSQMEWSCQRTSVSASQMAPWQWRTYNAPPTKARTAALPETSRTTQHSGQLTSVFSVSTYLCNCCGYGNGVGGFSSCVLGNVGKMPTACAKIPFHVTSSSLTWFLLWENCILGNSRMSVFTLNDV
jgi:hypothetical protein